MLATETAPSRPKADPDENHLFCCCNPDVSLCGLDISDEVEDDDLSDDETCLVCLALTGIDCPFCGH